MNVYAVQQLEVARRIGVMSGVEDISSLATALRLFRDDGVSTVVSFGMILVTAGAAVEAEENRQALYLVDIKSGDLPGTVFWIAPNIARVARELRFRHAFGADIKLRPDRLVLTPADSPGDSCEVELKPGARVVIDPVDLDLSILE